MIDLAVPFIGSREKIEVSGVLESKMIACGEVVAEFERQFAKYHRAKYAVAVVNGTAALHTALLACGVKPGDKVITTPFSFVATGNSILHCGAKPIFVDIDPDTFNIDPVVLAKTLAIEKNIKAVLLVHLYGLMCDMDPILKLQRKYKFKLIEDCAQAHASKYKGKFAGTFSDAASFSFYATKNITTGEGGMTFFPTQKSADYARQIINHGRAGHSSFTVLGYNYRMTNILAAIGLEQLEHLKEWTLIRQQNAAIYQKELGRLEDIKIPITPKGYSHSFHQYTLRVPAPQREDFMQHLRKNDVGCGIYYDQVIYRQPLYRKLGYKAGICPKAEQAAKEVVSIPVHPLVGKGITKVIEAIRSYKK
ncbi:MAG: DegT/DnrJ/EryC1/StrS family aminotransferase [Elusimicrobiota bacterium]|jgi:dTDP-4-amino-4,6-dideoxygalactose transaminase|nr:DegT/DnrJ/EryC1/StrS family aminotransferase [Elusimicrobiota bacterium]